MEIAGLVVGLPLHEGVVRVGADADVLEPDAGGALVVLDVLGGVEGVHLAAEPFHVLLKRELRVYADRVREAIARLNFQPEMKIGFSRYNR